MEVKWKKQSSKMSQRRINGYEIRLSQYNSMKNAKYVKVKSYNKTTVKVKSLKSKKKYYLQVRTYMTVGGKTYYSKWSGKKKETVR